ILEIEFDRGGMEHVGQRAKQKEMEHSVFHETYFDADRDLKQTKEPPKRHADARRERASSSNPGENFRSMTGPSISVMGSLTHLVAVVFVHPRFKPRRVQAASEQRASRAAA